MLLGYLSGADILVCQLGRLSSCPKAGLESPANRRLESLPHIVCRGIEVLNFGIQANGLHRLAVDRNRLEEESSESYFNSAAMARAISRVVLLPPMS